MQIHCQLERSAQCSAQRLRASEDPEHALNTRRWRSPDAELNSLYHYRLPAQRLPVTVFLGDLRSARFFPSTQYADLLKSLGANSDQTDNLLGGQSNTSRVGRTLTL